MAIGDELDKLLSDPRLEKDDWDAFEQILGVALPAAPNERRELLSKEIRHNYGHSVRNLFRDWFEPDHIDIVRDTAEKLDLKIKDHHTVSEMEDRILAEILDIAKANIIKEKGQVGWDEIERDVDKQITDSIDSGNLPPGVAEQLKAARGGGVIAAIIAGRFAGFALYTVVAQTFFAISRSLGLGIGVAVAGPIIGSTLSILLGPIGWLIGGAMVAYDLGNTNWKKTIPAVAMVAIYRRKLGL